MTFLERFLSLARADAHGVLDSLEDRGLLLRQCLREAELELARKRARRDELSNALETFARQREHFDLQQRAIDEDVQLALSRGEDELARYAIRRLIGLRRQAERASEQERELREELARLADKLEAQERELTELRDRVQQELERERAARARDLDPGCAPSAVRDEDVELELLRRRSGAEAQS